MSTHSRQNSVVKSTLTTLKGDKIGPWKLGSTLGAGSTGKVVMAQHESTGQQAAVKIVSKSIFGNQSNSSTIVGSNDPDVLPYGIEREIIIMKLLNHPNVLRLYDVWETNSSLYMVLEYVEKGELFNLLVDRGPLPENEAVRFFRQIIIGISYCHALGIVHRDLKPENLLLDHKFNIKIADFGMAALESKDKLLETSCGSPHYAAPEIVSGLPYHGFESDVWSCGIILFALLTGRLPFDEEDGNIRNLLLKVQSGKFEMPDTNEISGEAQDLIAKILTVDPAARIKSRGILKHPLLQKYPSIKDSKSIRNLPREDTYLNPLDSVDGTIDDTIIGNLVVLWHGRDRNEITNKLKEPGANLEKTFYALLFRFKHDSQQEQLKQQRRSQAMQVSPKKTGLRKSNSRRSINSTTPKKKTRAPVISASSSHKRPVSFSRLSYSNGSNTDHNTPNSSGKRSSVNLSSNKRISALINPNSSPTPASKRASLRELDPSAPPIPVDMLKDYNKAAPKANRKSSRISKRLSFLPGNKRGSITTKLIATYAKISEDNDWEYIEKETKRTSADFATLCDEIFEHEKYEQIRREKEELERRVREAKEQEERERRQREEEERRQREEELARQREFEEERYHRQREVQENIDREMALLKEGYETSSGVDPNKNRSVSAPVESVLKVDKRSSMDALDGDIMDLLNRRTFSLETRPKSRLDPGIYTLEEVPNSDIKDGGRDLKTEKTILETIRRSKFLGSSFDINKELARERRLKEERAAALKQRKKEDRVVSNATGNYSENGYEPQTLPKNAAATKISNDAGSDPRKISEVQVPQFTRRSRHFTASNKRLSVLSMYSTKASFTNLADHLRGKTDLQSINGSPPSTSRMEPETEFMFESVDGEGKETADTSADSRLYEVAEGNDPKGAARSAVRLNFADRFNKPTSPPPQSVEDPNGIKLPSLPPLDKAKSDGVNGLGLYQPASDSSETEIHHQPKSMIPVDAEQKEAAEAKPEEQKQVPPKDVESAPAPLNKVMKKNTEAEKNQPNQPAPNAVKKNNKSFFRRFSGKSDDEKRPGEYDFKFDTVIEGTQMFNALSKLLAAWKDYGLKDVVASPSQKKIKGKMSSDNMLSLRSTLFEISIVSKGEGSIVGFTKKSGSTKTFKKLVKEIEKILESKKALVFNN
ncbi:protein kinase GIN4 [Lachancea thermotolerans CBS 6340]|uniref:non-specific serine/threonine protein kinase n=1 Tax=Lachancea thermotolerans (strain ATCC 56472 / CBS 6340 / NRRL Y-8284) TaxID=559295 RepID=C5DK45_LACTC|nr:KLTH0F01672p [Lachancea thermotolerans CBS 6340]CAR23846.1 KLTH0F01672p [Lachancea thermotolerans CBS 6340]